jgi:hypothetical protein
VEQKSTVIVVIIITITITITSISITITITIIILVLTIILYELIEYADDGNGETNKQHTYSTPTAKVQTQTILIPIKRSPFNQPPNE